MLHPKYLELVRAMLVCQKGGYLDCCLCKFFFLVICFRSALVSSGTTADAKLDFYLSVLAGFSGCSFSSAFEGDDSPRFSSCARLLSSGYGGY